MSSTDSEQLDDNFEDLKIALLEVERDLVALRKRIAQVNQDCQRRAELKQQQQKFQQQQQNNSTKLPIKTDLARIEQELATIEQNLESRLLKWKDLIEPFWQAVRFGGAGVIIGWILKSLAQ